MEFKIFDLKTEITKNNIKLLDLSELNFKIIAFDEDGIPVDKVIYVDEHLEARPDLILHKSGKYDMNDVEILLKFNQITNPFSIKEGDIILIPNFDYAERWYIKEELKKDKKSKNFKRLYIQDYKKDNIKSDRIKHLEKISKRRKNNPSEIKPSNMLQPDQVVFEVDKINKKIKLSPFNSK